MHKLHSTIVGLAVLASSAGTASAGFVGTSQRKIPIRESTQRALQPVALFAFNVTQTDGQPQFMGQLTSSNQGSLQRSLDGAGSLAVSWSLGAVQDPTVFGDFSITNNSSIALDFDIFLSLAVAPLAMPPSMSGFIEGSVTDTNSSGDATLGVRGNSVYTALIDGSPASPGFLLSTDTTVTTPGGTTTIDRLSFASSVVPSVNSTIGIRHQFSLTPGDTVTLNTSFTVVPEPATLALLAVGSLVMLRRRRR